MPKRCDAFTSNSGGNPIPLDNTNSPDVATRALPAGNFVISAKVTLGDRSGVGGGAFLCSLRYGQTGNIGIDTSSLKLFGGAPNDPGSVATLSLAGTVSLTAPDTIRLRVQTTSTDAFAQWAQLSAIQVETITT
jgi:hypothetical protein